MPKNYKINSSFICSGRKENPGETEFCYNYNDVYPLKKVRVFKEEFSIYIPHKPHTLLRQIYGSSYMIPHTKGYKAVVCIFIILSIHRFFTANKNINCNIHNIYFINLYFKNVIN